MKKMKKLNQFITEYIIKKKLDHPINSEIDSTNITNTICEIFNIQDENIIDEINSFISKNKFNDAEYFMTRLETAIYKKHISKTNETINNINNGLHNMPKDVLYNTENEHIIYDNDNMLIVSNTYKDNGLITINYYLKETDIKSWVILTK